MGHAYRMKTRQYQESEDADVNFSCDYSTGWRGHRFVNSPLLSCKHKESWYLFPSLTTKKKNLKKRESWVNRFAPTFFLCMLSLDVTTQPLTSMVLVKKLRNSVQVVYFMTSDGV